MIPRLLRDLPDFRRYWTGQTISLFGDQVSSIALPLIAVLALHAGAVQMGYLTAMIWLPSLLFSLHLGSWIDRGNHKRHAMIAGDVGRALLLFSIPAAYLFGFLTFAQLVVVAFLAGSLRTLFQVSDATLFTSVVPRKSYVEANQLFYGSRAFSFVAGPSLGGVLVQILSAPVAILADALSFVGSALFLGSIRAKEPKGAARQPGHLIAGARFIRRSPLLIASLASSGTINLFNFAFWALYVLFATKSLHVQPAMLGILLGAAAVGGVLGALGAGSITRGLGIGPAFVAGCFLFTVPLLLVPLAGGPQPLVLGLLFLAEFVSGFGVMVLDIALGSMSQALVPDSLRGRVSGAYMFVNYGVRPLGALLGGALGSWLGLRPTLWIATAGAVLGVFLLFPSPVMGLRQLPAGESVG